MECYLRVGTALRTFYVPPATTLRARCPGHPRNANLPPPVLRPYDIQAFSIPKIPMGLVQRTQTLTQTPRLSPTCPGGFSLAMATQEKTDASTDTAETPKVGDAGYSFIRDELRAYAMRLHTKDQSPKEGQQVPYQADRHVQSY